MKKEAEDFYNIISVNEKRLREISDEKSFIKPAEGKWSAKEILGHLIDSSINNIVRFVTAQFKGDLVFNGYDHNKWVSYQNYQSYNWNFLVELWKMNNLHIVKIIEQINEDKYLEKFDCHNFDEISWKKPPKDSLAAIQYMFADYVGHMEHHLNQLFNIYQ